MAQRVNFTIEEFIEIENNIERFTITKTETNSKGVAYTNRTLTYTNEDGVSIIPCPLIKFKVRAFETKSYIDGVEPKYRLMFKLYDDEFVDDKVTKTLVMFQKMQDIFTAMALIPNVLAHTNPQFMQFTDKDGIAKDKDKLLLRVWPQYNNKTNIDAVTGEKKNEKMLRSCIHYLVPGVKEEVDKDTGEITEIPIMTLDKTKTVPSMSLRAPELSEIFKFGTIVACRVEFKLFTDGKSKKAYMAPCMLGDMFITPSTEPVGMTEEEALAFYN